MSNHPNRRKTPVAPTAEVTPHRIAQIAAGLDRVGKDLAKIADLFPEGFVPSGRQAVSDLSGHAREASRVYWAITEKLKQAATTATVTETHE